jgi:methionyl-tRNA formyltransferase
MTRIVFMGSPAEVVTPLRFICEQGASSDLEVVAVVSQPARPVGRGAKVADPPVAAFAKNNGMKCLQPESAKAKEFLEDMRSLRPDVVVTAAYGQILSDDFLQIPKIATINVHPSLLPAYRGATPVPATLLDGLTFSGVTILFTIKQLDAGNIISQKQFQISPNETCGELTERLFAESGPMLLNALERLAPEPLFKGFPQDHSKATFCRKIDKDMGAVNWESDAKSVMDHFRAFQPWPGSFTLLGDRRISLTKMTLDDSNALDETPGTVTFDKASKCIRVTCRKGLVAVHKLKPAGGKEMDAVSFWNGLKDRSAVVFSA